MSSKQFPVIYNNSVITTCATEQDAKLIKQFIIRHLDEYFNTLAHLSRIDESSNDTIDSFIKKAIPHINASIAQKVKRNNLVKNYLKYIHLQVKCTPTKNGISFIHIKLPEQAIIERFKNDNELFNNSLLIEANKKYAWFEIICKNRFYPIIDKYMHRIKPTKKLLKQVEQEINQLLQLYNYSSLQDIWLEYVDNDFKMSLLF